MAAKQKIVEIVLRFLAGFALFVILSILVFQRHQNTGYFNWRSKMWGDAVGYYIYSPALFIYGFDASKLPEKITEKTGEGFIIDKNGKIITRYTYGVALLQLPVFLTVHSFAMLTGSETDGFSGFYHLVSGFAAILYAFGGLLLMWHFLRNYYKRLTVFFILFTLFFGTNLLYYFIDATGMSHVYSFFLFALLLVLSHRYFKNTGERSQRILFFSIALTSCLIVLVRPTGVLFVGLVFLLDIKSFNELQKRIKNVFTPVNMGFLAASFFIVFLPQLLYWKYSSGSFLTDSYSGYGFTNWASPKIREFLFSTNNGLFTYNPVYFIIVFALVLMMIKKQINGYYIFTLFAGLIYIFSAWFLFSFGCGFGSRNFVEYTTIFALPLGYLYENYLKRNIFKWVLIVPVLGVFILVNAKLTSNYNKCFVDGDWQWKEYKYLLQLNKFSQKIEYNPVFSLGVNNEFSVPIRFACDTITEVNFRRAIIDSEIRIYDKDCKASIVFQVTTPDTMLYWNGVGIASQFQDDELGKFKIVKGDFWLPRHYTVNSEISTMIWNIGGDSLDIKKIKVHLE